MKNIIRRINVIAIVLITMLALSTNVNAASDSYKVSLSADHSQVHIGDELTLTVSLSDIAIESGEKGIGAYGCNIEFDSSIFEYTSTEGTEKWDDPFYESKKIIGTTNDGKVVNTAQDIGTITLKVKENATLGDTTIKLTNFSASNAVSEIETGDTSVKVTIQEKTNSNDDENDGYQDENNGGSGSENNGNENDGSQDNENGNDGNTDSQNGGSGNSGSSDNGNQSGSSTNINDAKKDNVKTGIIPQTGDIDILTFSLISIFALVAISLLIKMKLIDRKIKKNQ